MTLQNDLPDPNESSLETKIELDRIFSGLFSSIRKINDGSLEADQRARDLLIDRAKEELMPVLKQNGMEVIEFTEYGLVLAISVAYTSDRPESVIRLLVYSRKPFGELQIKVQSRIRPTADGESSEDKYNWRVGRDSLEEGFFRTHRLASTGVPKHEIYVAEGFDIKKLSDGRFSDDYLKSWVDPEDLTERLRMALYVLEKYNL